MHISLILFPLSLCLVSTEGGSHLIEDYPFSKELSKSPSYWVYWKMDTEREKSITFAVNVSTRGWVGFGISKNALMPDSDVVIGWISGSGKPYLHDCFARRRGIPELDVSQDWRLVSSERKDGNIILEMRRKLNTCDNEDIEITTSTLYFLWSIGDVMPESEEGPQQQHSTAGASRINILGQVEERGEPEDSDTFTISVQNVTVPSAATTYWCQVARIPLTRESYVYKFAPLISAGNENLVHHMLIYECPSVLINDDLGNLTNSSTSCEGGVVPAQVFQCRGTKVLAGWAIGGEEFRYPDEVGYRVGHRDSPKYVLLEVHYNNPKHVSGHVDNSGIVLSYTRSPPRHRAGVLTVGHHVTPNMLIPPELEEYKINGICSGMCTQRRFTSAEGINLFGGLLHTHLAGRSLVLRHYRETMECGGVEELPHIDQNLNYDVDFQQVNLFPTETKVLPGDSLVLQCSYNTRHRNTTTLGGEGTREEMCLTFLFYYPYQEDLSLCTSMPKASAYTPLRAVVDQGYDNLTSLLEGALGVQQSHKIQEYMDNVHWTQNLTTQLQQTSQSSPISQLCLKDFSTLMGGHFTASPPDVRCGHIRDPGTSECSADISVSGLPLCIEIAVALLVSAILSL